MKKPGKTKTKTKNTESMEQDQTIDLGDNTFSSGTDICQQLMDRYAKSAALQHRHLLATAAAMRSVLSGDSMPLTPPCYFAAAINAVDDLCSSESIDPDAVTALLSFLAIALPLVPRRGVSAQNATEAVAVLVGLVEREGEKLAASTVRAVVKCLAVLLVGFCVTLTESVIRPECVRNLTAPRYRKTQNVSLQQLKQALLSVPAESMYDYQHTWQSLTDSGRVVLTSGFDFARDLLSDDDFREVLHRRYHDLHNLALELQVPPEDNRDGQGNETQAELQEVDPSFGGIARGMEEVLKRLKIIEQEIRDLKQEIQGMRYYEHRLLVELHRKVDYLVNFNTQLEERRVPKMLYFVRTENYSRKLVTNMVSGMTALRLHMLCEYRGEMHVIEDQIGCEMMQVDNKAVKSLAPYMTKFMKLVTFALKIGAHLAAGMGELIPDLSRAVAHLSDSSAIYGAAGAVAAGAVGAAALGNMARTRQGSRDIQQQDMRAAEQWVLDFLRERRCSSGKDIAEKFGLWRARYRDNGHIAWICRRHRSIRANEIIEVPI